MTSGSTNLTIIGVYMFRIGILILIAAGLLGAALSACDRADDATGDGQDAVETVVESGNVNGSEPRPAYLDAEIRIEQLADGLYLLFGNGPNGNTGLSVGEDGAFLIDSQLASMSEKLLATVKNITDAPINVIINTHVHRDHIEGNSGFRQAYDAVVVAHNNVHERLRVSATAVDPAVLPDLTYQDSMTLYLNGQQLRIFSPGPSHTDGDSVVHFTDANVMFVGDIFFNHRFPFIDRANGGSLAGMISNVELLLEQGDEQTVFVPGHHPPATKEELFQVREMLIRTRDEVAGLIAAGNSAEEVIAAQPFADLYEGWQTGFMPAERYIRILYQELQD